MAQVRVLWQDSSGRITLRIRKSQASRAIHPGPCDADVLELARVPSIARQLAAIPFAHVVAALDELGCWSDEELMDDAQNRIRLLWVACGDIFDDMEKDNG